MLLGCVAVGVLKHYECKAVQSIGKLAFSTTFEHSLLCDSEISLLGIYPIEMRVLVLQMKVIYLHVSYLEFDVLCFGEVIL